MRLEISKRIIKAGDILEVKWNSEEGTAPRLILQTGGREVSLAVPESGSKRFRMKKSKGNHSVALVTDVYGKEKKIKKRILVYGQAQETDEFEYVDRGDASPINQMNNRISMWWKSYSPEKKRLYILLLLLLCHHALGSFPSTAALAEVLYYVLIFWLFWQVVKR